MAFCIWLLSLSIMFPRFIHIVAGTDTLFLLMAECYSIERICDILFLPFFHWWTFGLFLLFGYLWTCVYNNLFESLLSVLLRNVSRNGIARSYRNSVFNFLRDCQIIFQCSCTISYSHHQWMRVPDSLHPHQHSLSDFVMIAILGGIELYLTVALICIFLLMNDTERLSLHYVLLNQRQDLTQLSGLRLCFIGKCTGDYDSSPWFPLHHQGVRLAFWVLFHFHMWQRNWSPTSAAKLGHQPLTQSVGRRGGVAGCRLRKQIMGVLSLALHHLYDFGLNESLPVSVPLCLPVTELNNSNCLTGLLWRLDELLYESQHSVRVCNYCPRHSEFQLQLATAHQAQVCPAQLPSLLQVL